MFSQPHPRRAFNLLQRAAPSAGSCRKVVRDRSEAARRDVWMAAFANRLGELRPHEDRDVLRAVAADLWDDVGGHDPSICAEMEHEARSVGD